MLFLYLFSTHESWTLREVKIKVKPEVCLSELALSSVFLLYLFGLVLFMDVMLQVELWSKTLFLVSNGFFSVLQILHFRNFDLQSLFNETLKNYVRNKLWIWGKLPFSYTSKYLALLINHKKISNFNLNRHAAKILL